MLRFKKLLNEVSEEGIEKKLSNFLPDFYGENLQKTSKKTKKLLKEYNQSGKWYKPKSKKFFIYRGSSYDVKFWDIKKIRQDRVPRDTPMWIDQLIENVRSKYYPDVPSRRAIKFGGSGDYGKEEIEKYGEPFIVFPQKNAPIVSYPEDTLNVMRPIYKSSKEISSLVAKLKGKVEKEKPFSFFKSKFPEIYKFLHEFDQVDNLKSNYREDDFDYYPSIKPSKIKRRIEEFDVEDIKIDDYFLRSYISEVLKEVEVIFEKVDDYFSSFHRGVKPNSGEVMYGGTEFLRVRYDFWKHFIEYDFSSGKIKSLVSDVKKNAIEKKKEEEMKEKWKRQFPEKFAETISINLDNVKTVDKDHADYTKYLIVPNGYKYEDMKFIGPDNLIRDDGVIQLFIEFPNIQDDFEGNLNIKDKSIGTAIYIVYDRENRDSKLEVEMDYGDFEELLDNAREVMKNYFS